MKKKIAITESYLMSIFKLSNQSKKATLSTIKKISESSKSSALQIHDIDRYQCDKKLRSARVNKDLRIIFLMQGEVYTLLYVDHHDDAYKWCDGKYLGKTNFGAEYIYDEKEFNDRANDNTSSNNVFFGDLKSLLEEHGVKKKEIVKLGITEVHAETIMKINDENKLLDYVMVFPEELQEAILDLASGTRKFDEVYNSLKDFDENEISIDGIEQKDSQRRFYVTKNIEELEYLMENDEFDKWKLFLHPSQRSLVDTDYNGPVLVEGGPGTGKTIVGIHRAIRLSEKVYKASEGKKILVCTYSKKLAKIIRQKTDELLKQKNIESNIDVFSVDSYIYQLLSLNQIKINVDMKVFLDLFDRIYYSEKRTEPIEFYHFEYFEIIEKNQISTKQAYLEVDRSGSGKALQRSSRQEVWKFFDKLLQSKKEFNVYTFVDRAVALNELISKGNMEMRYDAIIIDEAQDLESTKLKAVSNSVKNINNGLFILSDINQRIFRLTTWKNDVGINIVGRTFYLNVNYRTTKQISDYARFQFVQTKITKSHIREYKSITNGIVPTIEEFLDESSQFKFIVDKVSRYILSGYPMYEIGIICPSNSHCSQIKSILEINDIDTNLITGESIPEKGKGVSICTSSGVKGLEFSVVIIFEYEGIGQYKLPYLSKPEINLDYTKLVECEKYVAATRARDELTITYVEEEEE